MITLALWLLRFAMSSMWLYWLATWFRPLFDAMRQLLADLWVFPLCLTAATRPSAPITSCGTASEAAAGESC